LRVHARQPRNSQLERQAWSGGRRKWINTYAAQLAGRLQDDWRAGHYLSCLRPSVRLALLAPGWAMRTLTRRSPRVTRRRARGGIDFGDLASVRPLSTQFGFDRGLPIDRYYIERFLERFSADVAGSLLEVGDDGYSRRFGGSRVTQQDVLHVHPGNLQATIVGDLAEPGLLPDNSFDCMIITQTLQLIFDFRAAITGLHEALKPGGVLLLTVPSISQLDVGEAGSTWYWTFTPLSMMRMFCEEFGSAAITVDVFGNVFAATAFLQGVAAEEVDCAKLQPYDPAYPVVIAVRAQKALV